VRPALSRAGRLTGSSDDAGGAGRGGATSARAKHALVLSREQAAGRSIATRVIDRPTLSLWILFVPVLLVDYVYRQRTYQAGVEAFAREFIHARKVALDAALLAVEGGLEKAEALARLTRDGATGPEGEAAAARRAQRREIELLFDHYALLLRAEGEGYEALLRNAYVTAARYERFLERLRAAERETGEAVRRSLGAANDIAELVVKTEQAVEAVRLQEAKRVFS
jgi:hypothetical protein